MTKRSSRKSSTARPEQARENAIRRAKLAARSLRSPRFILRLPDGRFRQCRDMGVPELGDGISLVAVIGEDGAILYESKESGA